MGEPLTPYIFRVSCDIIRSMKNKDLLLKLLMENENDFLSGSNIAKTLGISRAAVWKNIKLLESEGFTIEAVNNKGYRLSESNDGVHEDLINKFLGNNSKEFNLNVFSSIPSTNTWLKENADDLPGWSVAVAGNQTSGRGRSGRSFFSPDGTGVYLSLLLKEKIGFEDAGRLTTAAAVAACNAIEHCTSEIPSIKWVNDVFVRNRKVCGILTEANINYETGFPDWIVTGIGFNVYEPENGFPDEIKDIAGAITLTRKKNLRSELAGFFINDFHRLCSDLNNKTLFNEYKKRCFILGRKIDVLTGKKVKPATALDLREDFALIVRYDDGREEALKAGEVSTRPVQI